MEPVRHLQLEGQLVATAEVVDTYRHDRDRWDTLYVFRANDGYTLIHFGRRETYTEAGAVERGIADITVEQASDVRQLEELVSERLPTWHRRLVADPRRWPPPRRSPPRRLGAGANA